MSSPATFADLGLDDRLLHAIDSLGYETPTPIQDRAIPPMLAGKDLVGRARTGSGKTGAFGLSLLQRITRDNAVRALVLAPTRELAQQVTQALRSFDPGVRIHAIYGGTAYQPQLRALSRGVNVVVGTPGRVLDLISKGSLDLSALEVFVLDEGDQMLQFGFIEDVEKILDATRPGRQVALFSATMPDPVRRLAERYLDDPVEISIGGEGPSIDHIEQQWMRVPHRHKLDALVRVLEGNPGVPAIVFARTRQGCAELADALARRGLSVDALHGDLTQAARERVLARLKAGQLEVLIATDVAARGLDVERLELVINLDLPANADDYVHRIGRTGRAGREGRAINFVAPGQFRFVKDVKRKFGVDMEELPVPSDADVVRQQRRSLEDSLEAVRDDADADADAAAAIGRLLATGEWTAEQIAAAALHLLAEAHGIELGELPDDAPPEWSVPRSRHDRHDRNDRRDRGRGRDDRGRDRGGRDPHPGGPDGGGELFVAAGHRHGVRPGDLVGALANELGIPGSRIGKIKILDTKSFVGLSERDLDRVLRERRALEVRGRQAKLDRARGPRR